MNLHVSYPDKEGIYKIEEEGKLYGFIHTPEKKKQSSLEAIANRIKENPFDWSVLPGLQDISLALIIAVQNPCQLRFVGDVGVKIKRQDKETVIDKDSEGDLLATDEIEFILKLNASHSELVSESSTDEGVYPEQSEGMPKLVRHDRVIKLPNFTFPSLKQTDFSKKSLFLLLAVALTFFMFLSYQLRNKSLDEKHQFLANLEKTVTTDLSENRKLGTINSNLARKQLQASKARLEEAAIQEYGANWTEHNSKESVQVKKLRDNLQAAILELGHIYPVTPTIFYDVSLLKTNATITAAALAKNTITVLDSYTGTIYQVGTTDKAAVVALGKNDLQEGRKIDSGGKTGVLTNTTLLILPDKKQELANATEIAAFRLFADTAYFLRPTKNDIEKVAIGSSGSKSYLAKDIAVNLSQGIDLTIDGSVYVLTKTGNVIKFIGGVPEDFSIKGLDQPLSNPTSIFTGDEGQNLYILDSGNHRVVVIDKKGVYQSQYIFPSTFSPTVLLTDESVKKIFLSSGSKIYALDLR